MKFNLKFLYPRLSNVVITLLVISLPLIKERVQLPTGEYEVVMYRPIFLLASYLQMNDYYPFFLMVCFSLVVYVVVSGILAAFSRLIIKSKRAKR